VAPNGVFSMQMLACRHYAMYCWPVCFRTTGHDITLQNSVVSHQSWHAWTHPKP